jgi:hypothetical protein
MLKLYGWDAKLLENKEVEVSFKLQGINKPEIFVAAFQAGKSIIESMQGGTGMAWFDYIMPVSYFATLIQQALKKSQ